MATTTTNKLVEANTLLVGMIRKSFAANTWAYQDFVNENRFLSDAANDPDIDIDNWSGEEIAEFAFGHISSSFSRSILLGPHHCSHN